MIKLYAETTEEMTQEFIDRKRDIAVEIVKTILYAIENSLDEVSVDIECQLVHGYISTKRGLRQSSQNEFTYSIGI